MDKQMNVAWPLARIMRKSANGKNICVGIQYQWTNGERQNRMDGKDTLPLSELTFVPIPPEDVQKKPPRK